MTAPDYTAVNEAIRKAPPTTACEVCDRVAPTATHPCRFSRGCSCWRGEPCRRYRVTVQYLNGTVTTYTGSRAYCERRRTVAFRLGHGFYPIETA